MTCIEEPLRTKSRPICASVAGDTASCTQGAPITAALAKTRDSAPDAASTAAVLEASAAVPAACDWISRKNSVGEIAAAIARLAFLFLPRPAHGQVSLNAMAREYRGQDWLSSTTYVAPA